MTLLETILAVAIAAALTILLARLFEHYHAYFRRVGAGQQATLEARICAEAIAHMLRQGRAASAVVSTPASTPVVPNSRLDFQMNAPLTSGATAYAFYLGNGSLLVQEYNPELANPPAPRVLSAHAVSLVFGTDARDPAQISFSLQVRVPWDASGDPAHAASVALYNQLVRLGDVP